jgi:hypothetical protein
MVRMLAIALSIPPARQERKGFKLFPKISTEHKKEEEARSGKGQTKVEYHITVKSSRSCDHLRSESNKTQTMKRKKLRQK